MLAVGYGLHHTAPDAKTIKQNMEDARNSMMDYLVGQGGLVARVDWHPASDCLGHRGRAASCPLCRVADSSIRRTAPHCPPIRSAPLRQDLHNAKEALGFNATTANATANATSGAAGSGGRQGGAEGKGAEEGAGKEQEQEAEEEAGGDGEAAEL
jgi:hypothetical protein